MSGLELWLGAVVDWLKGSQNSEAFRNPLW